MVDFVLVEDPEACAVMWQKFPRSLFENRKLLDVLFTETECDEACLLIGLNNKENEVFTVDKSVWAQDRVGNYGDYLQDYYVINGVMFKQKREAQDFHTWLEKEYIWQELKA